MTCSKTVFIVISKVSRTALCGLLGLCLMAGLLSRAAAVSASTTIVTRTADDLQPGSLRSAIAAAAGMGATITFAIPTTDPGYNGASNTDTITLSLGPLVIPGSLTITGPAAPAPTVVVSGAPYSGFNRSMNASRVFSVTGGTVAFSSLTITNGNVSPGNPVFPEPDGGGGILNTATLTLTGCTVTGNSSIEGTSSAAGVVLLPSGGGINNSGPGADLTMTNCTISRNDGYAGGGGIDNSGTLTLTGCIMLGNIVGDGGNGGGLFNTGMATLSNCTLVSNELEGAGDGGGAYNTGTLTMSACLLDSNRATSGGRGGGGVENDSGGTLVLNGCTVIRNEAELGGGAGGINNIGAAQIADCLVVNNLGNYVGGMDNTGTLTLINSTFTGNLSAGNLGPATFAGGLISGPATLINDILYFDATYAGVTNFNGSPLPSEIATPPGMTGPTITYSDVQGGYAGANNISADPQFVQNPVLSFNETVYRPGDEHLMLTSPAAHAGANAPGVPLTDIVGTPRPAPPATPSMGAYEIIGFNGFNAQGGFLVTATQNASTGTQVVAKFLPGPTPISSFSAAVELGDGSLAPGVIVPDPATAGVFDVTVSHTYVGSGIFTVTVIISGPGGTPTATVTSMATIQPFLSSLTFPSPVPGGTVLTATVTLSGPALSDTVVGLSSSDSSVVRLHRSVIVPIGSSSATFAINTFRSHVSKTVTITVALDQTSLMQNLTITGR